MKWVALVFSAALFVLVFLSPLIAEDVAFTTSDAAYVTAKNRLETIKKNGEKLSEEELDSLLIAILASKKTPLDYRQIHLARVLALASQFFRRDMTIKFGQRRNFPPRTKALLEILEHPPSIVSPAYNAARDSIQSVEEGAPHLSDQELDKLLLAILEDKNTPLWKKKVHVRRLSDWANRVMGHDEKESLPPIAEALLQKLVKEKKEEERLIEENKKAFQLEEESRLLAEEKKRRLEENKHRQHEEKLRQEFLRRKQIELERIKNEKEEHDKKCADEHSRGRAKKSPSKITGAFGFTLGQKFSPNCAVGSGALRDGTPMYQFNPESPFRSFKKYYVMVTPISHKVYSIWGIGHMKSDPVCKKELALVISLLKKKYGETTDTGLVGVLYNYQSINQHKKSVSVKCTGFTDSEIDIRYYDDTLREAAEKERIKQESAKLDASGL